MKIVDTNQYNIDSKKLRPCDWFVIEGKTYPTKQQAMTAFNISKDVLQLRCRSNAFPNWQRFDRLSRALKVKDKNSIPRQKYVIYVDGKEMSEKELIRKYKIVDSTIKGRCLSPNFPTWVMKHRFTGETVQKRSKDGRSNRRGVRKVMADNRVFDSIPLAARTLKVDPDTIRYRLKKNWKGYKIYE